MSDNSTLIPSVLDTYKGRERVSDLYSRLFNDRIIFLNGRIDYQVSNLICAQIMYLNQDERDIQLYINSPGGSADDGLAIYDVMMSSRCKIKTVIVGLAASAASIVSIAGTPGKRFATRHSKLMIHQSSITLHEKMTGQEKDIRVTADELLKMNKILVNIYKKHTLLDKEKIEMLLDKDSFIDAPLALEMGFTDEIVGINEVVKGEITNTIVKGA